MNWGYAAYEYQNNIENNENIIVGTNKYNNQEDTDSTRLKIDKLAIKDQLNRLEKFKKDRDDEKVKHSLQSFSKVLKKSENLLPYVIDCIKNHCTLGEICHEMKKIHGEHI